MPPPSSTKMPKSLRDLALYAWQSFVYDATTGAEVAQRVCRAPKCILKMAPVFLATKIFLFVDMDGFRQEFKDHHPLIFFSEVFMMQAIIECVSQFVSTNDRVARAKLAKCFPDLLSPEFCPFKKESRFVRVVFKELHLFWTYEFHSLFFNSIFRTNRMLAASDVPKLLD
jgi:hypothetical protein